MKCVLFETGNIHYDDSARELERQHIFNLGKCLARHLNCDCDCISEVQRLANWRNALSGEGVVLSRFQSLGKEELCIVTHGDRSVTQVYAAGGAVRHAAA